MIKVSDEEPNPTPEFEARAGGEPVLGVRALLPQHASEMAPWQQRAIELGWAKVGVAPIDATTLAREAQAKARTAMWVAEGLHGSMEYMAAPRRSPVELLPNAKSVVVALAVTEDVQPGVLTPPGRVAAYARGADYHGVLKAKLWQLAQHICDEIQVPLQARVCVDTAPLLERFWAQEAGVAFIGKSTMAIAPGLGTNVLLSVLVIDAELPAARPLPSACGQCTLCLDVCPTDAFVAPFVLDAARCIAFLTIENPGEIPVQHRTALGERVFGCDECQAVCPYNGSRKRPRAMAELVARAETTELDLARWVSLTSGDYRRLTTKSALRRAPRAQLQRNAVVALGNRPQPSPQDVSALERSVEQNPSPLVRKHAAWALAQVDPKLAKGVLGALRTREPEPEVRAEFERLLAELDSCDD